MASLERANSGVNVRPGRLTNGKARGAVKASMDSGVPSAMTREDLAAFMVEQIASDTWVGKSPLIG